ncbi:hypothetical protein GCM10011390_50860 [Aureimonas endophytica]|uniref:DUF2798 domain-containing protein n=1 Tax=Aureimonas endophytica TaxID=2027858 RepID=A0A917A4V3_9HYPH|nr:DUF2798 domain-containing protein [Aureimonas endophytica]GGE25206.1 hypothetical protein GCM10011390_50860 [Aureimonas endophytica]
MRTSRKLPAPYGAIITPLLLSLMMCCIVSGISTARAVGLADDLLAQWARGWGLSWLVAFPTLLFVLPVVRRVTGWLVEAAPR